MYKYIFRHVLPLGLHIIWYYIFPILNTYILIKYTNYKKKCNFSLVHTSFVKFQVTVSGMNLDIVSRNYKSNYFNYKR